MRLCSFGQCDRPTKTATHCKAHYQQLRRGGSLTPLRKVSPRGHRKPKEYVPCGFLGCDKTRHTLQWCVGHYNQLWRGGHLRPLGERLNPATVWDLETIFASCTRSDDCLLFGTEQVSKYPQIRYGDRAQVVHRVVYTLHSGEDITGVPIHHKCGNSKCVNPDHLEPASATENTLEMLGRKAYEARIRNLEARVRELEDELAAKAVIFG